MSEIFKVTAKDPEHAPAAKGVAHLLDALFEPHWPEWQDRFRDLALAEAFYGVNSPQWEAALQAMHAAKEAIVAQITADLKEQP